MLFARFQHGGFEGYGLVADGGIQALEGDLFGEHRPSGEELPLDSVRLLAPVARPGKVLAAAVNYPSHVAGSQAMTGLAEAPKKPELFLKPSSSIIGPEETIVLPRDSGRVDYEGELVAVIGRACRGVGPEEALTYVFGYTCGDDVSARHWQRDDLQWWRAKGSDTFSPIGPFIATGLDPADLELRTRLNGREVQAANTGTLIHSVAALIAFASSVMTLEPGDLVFTGTPGETGRLSEGDVVEVEIGGIGVLRNAVRAEAD
ncbi:MAG: fumarylacetoacetate hydrolase family protein [Dehalococcoidia bacterium]|nr:fumarylacetoacetate hydrolase family protein [Dehalococcoidia bacterium]